MNLRDEARTRLPMKTQSSIQMPETLEEQGFTGYELSM